MWSPDPSSNIFNIKNAKKTDSILLGDPAEWKKWILKMSIKESTMKIEDISIDTSIWSLY